jgi:hypothetical protein
MESSRLKEIAIATVGLVIALVFLVFFLLSHRSFGVSTAASSATPPGSIAPQVLGVEFSVSPSTNTQFVLLPGQTSIVTARVTAPGSTVSISGPTAIRTQLQTSTATAFRTVTPHPAPTVTRLLAGPTATSTFVQQGPTLTNTTTVTTTATATQTQTVTATRTVTPAPVTVTPAPVTVTPAPVTVTVTDSPAAVTSFVTLPPVTITVCIDSGTLLPVPCS